MNFRNIITGLLGVLLFGTSCSEEHTPPAAGEGTVHLQLSRTAVAGPTGYTPENAVKNARIFIFRDGRLETMRVFNSSEINTLSCELRVRAGTSDIHVLLNAPDAMIGSLAQIATPDDLQTLTFEIADFLTDNANKSLDDVNKGNETDYALPWYGVKTGVTISTETTRTLKLDVARAVARVDLYLRRKAGSEISCKIDPAEDKACLRITRSLVSGYVASGVDNISGDNAQERVIRRGSKIDLPVADGTEGGTPDAADYRLAYSFYLPEQYFADPAYLPVFRIEGTQWGDEGWIPELDPDVEGPYSFTLGQGIAGFDNRMSRNTVYTLFGTLTQQGYLVGFTIEVQPWNYKQQQGDIGN